MSLVMSVWLECSLDRDTGLYLCQARWYDPVTARWVTRDPIGYAGGANLYGYCGGGPVGSMDPSGLQKGGLTVKSPQGAQALVEAETGGMGPMGAVSTAEWNQTVASALGQMVRMPPPPWVAPAIRGATVLASECYGLLARPTASADADLVKSDEASFIGHWAVETLTASYERAAQRIKSVDWLSLRIRSKDDCDEWADEAREQVRRQRWSRLAYRLLMDDIGAKRDQCYQFVDSGGSFGL